MGSDEAGKFRRYVSLLPVDWRKLVGMAFSYFFEEQNPEDVTFARYDNGYVIEVKTDEENAKRAEKFWRENVEGRK